MAARWRRISFFHSPTLFPLPSTFGDTTQYCLAIWIPPFRREHQHRVLPATDYVLIIPAKYYILSKRDTRQFSHALHNVYFSNYRATFPTRFVRQRVLNTLADVHTV